MHPKTIITIVLLAFVAVSVGYLVVIESRSTDETSKRPIDAAGQAADTDSVTTATHKVVVYYLHSTQRCSTCLKIEERSANAVRSEFADALERGEVEWRVLDMEAPPNEHFVTEFGLVASSLVIVDVHDGQQHAWTNMQRVWELVHEDEAAFTKYVSDQVRAYLESGA